MTKISKTRAASLALGATLLTAVALPAAALAGECPAGDVLASPQTLDMKDGAKVEETVLDTIPLTGWRGVDGLMLRTRRLVIAPGGMVPTHSHADRPAIITIVSGEIVEHSSVCRTPIVHKAGDTTAEFGADLSHWWENTSDAPVTVLSSDVVPAQNPDKSMM
ncbi:cupin domain-containing protein [Acuticoccus kandeliae]|uniref:cupin domain-containing protein n=1 Tax=Acuticoccus kandeliae TaxID=2073160 RepID=UPI00196B3C52|nr:cupin domain-containing protein [Acuticoccus kandeliae]